MDYKVFKKKNKKWSRMPFDEAIQSGLVKFDDKGIFASNKNVKIFNSIDVYDIHGNPIHVGDCILIDTQMYVVVYNESNCQYGLLTGGIIYPINEEVTSTMCLVGHILEDVLGEDKSYVAVIIPRKNGKSKSFLSNYQYN